MDGARPDPELPLQDPSRRTRVLITGAYGLIGNLVSARLASRPNAYDVYGLVKNSDPSRRAELIERYEIPAGQLRLADVSDFAAVRQAVEAMEVVVHLAADPDGKAEWASVLHNNIIGARNVFEACRLARVKRVIYASKVFGEALAHMYADTHGLSCICLRIGWVVPDDRLPHPYAQSLWCSQRDIVQLIERCINAPDSLRFDIFFGQSNNRHNLVDIQHAVDVLGYAPQDRAEDRLA